MPAAFRYLLCLPLDV